MKLTLIPQWGRDAAFVFVAGDVLTINGHEFDFTDLGDGDSVDMPIIPEHLFLNPVSRINGTVEATIICHAGPYWVPGQPQDAITIDPASGAVTVFAWQEPVAEDVWQEPVVEDVGE